MKSDPIAVAVKAITTHLAETVAESVANALNEAFYSKQIALPYANPEGALVYSVDQIASLLSISKDSVYSNLIRTPGFPCLKVGKQYLIPAAAFHIWLNSREVE